MQSVSTVSSEDGCNRNVQMPPLPPPASETGQSCKDEEDNDLTITNDHDDAATAASLNFIPEL